MNYLANQLNAMGTSWEVLLLLEEGVYLVGICLILYVALTSAHQKRIKNRKVSK